MLKHPIAREGRSLLRIIYPDGDVPAGLADRLHKRSQWLMRSPKAGHFLIGVLLHGLAEAVDSDREARHG